MGALEQQTATALEMHADHEITDQDLVFEENCLQNPYVEDVWDKYIQFLLNNNSNPHSPKFYNSRASRQSESKIEKLVVEIFAMETESHKDKEPIDREDIN